MGGQLDRAKGRIKEATGVLTGNKELRRQGKADQVAAEAALNVEKGASQARKAVDQGAAAAGKAIDQVTAEVQKLLRKK